MHEARRMREQHPKGLNGHPADPLEWRPPTEDPAAAAAPLRPREKRGWWQAMTGRRSPAAEPVATPKLPAWVPGSFITIAVLLVTGFGTFMEWRGGVNKDLAGYAKALDKLDGEKDLNSRQEAAIKGLEQRHREEHEYVELLSLYCTDIRALLKSRGVSDRDLPRMPTRSDARRRAREATTEPDDN